MEIPDRLRLLHEFLNSGEELATAEGMTAWFRRQGLLGADDPPASLDDHRRALAVRNALRGLAAANNGGPLYPIDLATLNQAAADCPAHLRFTAGGSCRLESAGSGAHAALGRLLLAAFGAMTDGTWTRLKVCRRRDCRAAFYDGSKNRSRAWCSMAVCGNRAKVEAFRRRGAGSATAQSA